jgi:Flp pilus assembly protein CpaB
VENILSSKLFTTRRGTIMLGIVAAVLAGIALLVYLNQYRSSVNGGGAPTSVLVAKSLIQKGTPGDVVGSTGLFEVATIPRGEVKNGAFVDPKTLTGKVATADVYPGQQLTSTDFTVATANSLTQRLARDQRAVVVPLDSPAAIGGQLSAGDHVDVWAAINAQGTSGLTRPVVRLVLQNMLIMTAPAGAGGNVTIRATPRQAGMLIFANTNARLWLVLRPSVGSAPTKPPVVSVNDLLGLPPLQIGGSR